MNGYRVPSAGNTTDRASSKDDLPQVFSPISVVISSKVSDSRRMPRKPAISIRSKCIGCSLDSSPGPIV
ncbi:Uncharacterised protein [Vibrio cholerae]|nr:Uncharacterised protein [Vibrio cholerae]